MDAELKAAVNAAVTKGLDGFDPREMLSRKVVDLLERDGAYRTLLETILAVEDTIGREPGWASAADGSFLEVGKPWGWKMEDVPDLTGGHLRVLEEAGLIRRAYDSRQYHFFRAVDPEALRAGLERAAALAAEALQLMEGGGFLSGFTVTAEDEATFRELLAEHDGLEYWSEGVASKIVGMPAAKKAVLLALASTEDKHESKNRLHALLWGPPETGKTQVARALSRLGGGWASGAGRRTSKVGLTADASEGELTPGALPRNHYGACGVDEIDKFAGEDQGGLLEAMEEGFVTVNLGKFSERLSAEVIVVATANHLEPLKAELLSRFDLVVRMPLPSVQEAELIAQDIIEWWDRPKAKATHNLGKFLKWVRAFDPQLPDSVRREAVTLVRQQIRLSRETRPRRIESILRVAKALARLNRRDVTKEDVTRSLELLAEMNNRVEEEK